MGDVALAQLMLGGMLALVASGAFARRLGARAAFLSAILILIDPLTIIWSMTVLTETLLAAALGTSAVLLANWAHSRRNMVLILAGLFLALAILVKPLAMLVAAVWGAAILVMPLETTAPKAMTIRRAIRRGFLFALPSILLVVPWFVRNGMLWDCPALSSVDRVTMRDYMAAKVLAEAEQVDLSVTQSRLQDDDPGLCPSKTAKYWKIILDHPDIYARLHVAGTIPVLIGTNFDRWLQYLGAGYHLPDLWRPYMDGGWRELWSVITEQIKVFPEGLALLLGLSAFQLVFYGLALKGTITALRGTSIPGKWVAVAMTLAILILVLIPGQGGHERFRVAVQPLLAILAAYGFAERAGSQDPLL
jgi:4-amino-4-deoxy-L-arabinose transferase-like glycosyltransferase